MPPRILVIDLSERELKERQRLIARKDQLDALLATSHRTGGLTSQQQEERNDIEAALDSDHPVDEMYRAVAVHVARRKDWDDLINSPNADEFILKHGIAPTQHRHKVNWPALLAKIEHEVVSVCGLLQLDNITAPTLPHFVRRMSEAQGEYRENEALFDAAYERFTHRFNLTLQSQIDEQMVDAAVIGCIDPGGSISARDKIPDKSQFVPNANDIISALSAKSVAAVVRRLAQEGITANDPWLKSRLDNAFDTIAGVGAARPPSAMEIMLPDLEEAVDVEIVKDNLYAVQAIYFCFTLEEMRLFQVVERIVELFRQGLLPLGRGKMGDYLFGYYKRAAERFTESERRDLYMRLFGAPGGNPVGGEPNRDFNELWLRFVAAVSSFARQLTVERMLRGTVPLAVSQEQVRKAGRDLAANLSRNGFGIAYFAATELQQSVLEFRDLLQDAEVRSAFGARDMWQVIDTVNVNYLGGARNTYRYRTQSRAGAVIIRWLANNSARLAGVAGNVIDISQVLNPVVRAANTSTNPTVDPTDWDLVNACEQWLAVGGVPEASVEQYSQSIESPVITSKPIEIPQIAREVLDGIGMGIPAM